MKIEIRKIILIILVAVFWSGACLHAEPWNRRREGKFVILSDRTVAAGDLDRLAGILKRIEVRLKQDLDFSFELPVMVRVHGATAAYSEATGQVWWHGACTCGGQIHLQPPHILIERGIFEWVTVHEVTHQVLRALTAGNLPLWFDEGYAELMALESVSAIDVEPEPENLKKYSFPDPKALEDGLVQTRDRDKAEAAYRVSAQTMAKLRTRFGYGLIKDYFDRLQQEMEPDKAFERTFGITVQEFWRTSKQWPLTSTPAPGIKIEQK